MEKEKYFEATEFENIKELIYDAVQKYQQKTAFIIKHKKEKEVSYEKVSYTRLLEDINQIGSKFYDLGYQNKRIAIVGRNRYEWVITHLANLLGGIVSIPLDKELQIDELESCCIRSKADVLVFDEKYIENIEEIKARGNTQIENYICMSEQEGYQSIQKLKQQGKEIIETAQNRLDFMINELVKKENITEELKEKDQLAWVSSMNSIKSIAEEIIYSELIYV